MRIPPLLLVIALVLAGCSEPKKITEGIGLEGADQQRVADGVQRAREAKAWTSAWNQAVDAALPRSTLEAIAVETIADDELGLAASMFQALREEHGGVTPTTRDAVRRLSAEAMADERWEKAAEIELLAADDRGAFAGAWAVYQRTPPDEAPAVLSLIDEARREANDQRDGN